MKTYALFVNNCYSASDMKERAGFVSETWSRQHEQESATGLQVVNSLPPDEIVNFRDVVTHGGSNHFRSWELDGQSFASSYLALPRDRVV